MKDKSSVNAAWQGSSLQSQIVIVSIEEQAGLFNGGGRLIETGRYVYTFTFTFHPVLLLKFRENFYLVLIFLPVLLFE